MLIRSIETIIQNTHTKNQKPSSNPIHKAKEVNHKIKRHVSSTVQRTHRKFKWKRIKLSILSLQMIHTRFNAIECIHKLHADKDVVAIDVLGEHLHHAFDEVISPNKYHWVTSDRIEILHSLLFCVLFSRTSNWVEWWIYWEMRTWTGATNFMNCTQTMTSWMNRIRNIFW